MKIVVLDRPHENPGELDWSALETLGSVTYYDRTPPEQVAEHIGDAEIVLLNKAEITAQTLERCPNVRFISVIATGYTDEALDRWAQKITEWTSAGRDVFVYFDNDIKGYAPFDAMKLIERVGR